MKFGKHIKAEINRFPSLLQKHFIDYKKWKLLAKEYKNNMQTRSIQMQVYRTSTIIRLLLKDLELVDYAFKHTIRNEYSCFSNILSLFGRNYKESEKFAYDFAMINAEAVRKICKRLDKSINKTTFSHWFVKCRENHKYAFLGGKELTYLTHKYGNKEKECPICMENRNELVILNCGHVLCLNCISQIRSKFPDNCPYCNYAQAYLNTIKLSEV